MLCYTISCYDVICYDMLYYVVLCYVVLCYVIDLENVMLNYIIKSCTDIER